MLTVNSHGKWQEKKASNQSENKRPIRYLFVRALCLLRILIGYFPCGRVNPAEIHIHFHSIWIGCTKCLLFASESCVFIHFLDGRDMPNKMSNLIISHRRAS